MRPSRDNQPKIYKLPMSFQYFAGPSRPDVKSRWRHLADWLGVKILTTYLSQLLCGSAVAVLHSESLGSHPAPHKSHKSIDQEFDTLDKISDKNLYTCVKPV